MSSAFEQDDELIHYLLGRASESERAEVESRLFTDEDFNDEVLATADDLIDAYLAGTLSPEDRACFETDFLSVPHHRQRLEFMRDFGSALERAPRAAPATVDSHGPPARRRREWWLVAAVAVLAVGALLTAFALRTREPGQRTAGGMSASAPPAEPTPRDSKHPASDDVRRIVLSPSRGAVDVLLRRGTSAVRLEVEVREERPSYEATLRAQDGRVVWRVRGLPPVESGRPVIVTLPARVLVADAYTLRIEGESLRDGAQPEPLALEYRLRVIREP